ncbi:hypothetical protein A3F38_00565 [Candidatus Saccharibacteria bacterium RIFCSPHIGHO2_12_FULL_48_21]|nr:MAG: hypothetical protein A3F38_00565 [Candidatus Saccharibacteria bacterium RIFCSPHIGHO2_12_FULL_48_21]
MIDKKGISLFLNNNMTDTIRGYDILFLASLIYMKNYSKFQIGCLVRIMVNNTYGFDRDYLLRKNDIGIIIRSNSQYAYDLLIGNKTCSCVDLFEFDLI